MQEMLYYDAPYLVTAYTAISEAYRSDRCACFQPQPDPGGILLIQYGIHNYLSIRPADEAGDCDGVDNCPRRGTGVETAADRTRTRAAALRWSSVASSCWSCWCWPAEVWALRRRSTAADRE